MKHYTLERFTTPRGRFYTSPDGGRYPGVTTVLDKTKPEKDRLALEKWKEREGAENAERQRRNACDRGSALHELIEAYAREDTKAFSSLWGQANETVQAYFRSGYPVINTLSRVEVLLQESSVWSCEYGYAGTLDCLVGYKGKVKLLDWKTSTKPKRSDWIQDYFLQLAAYSQAITEMYSTQVDSASVVIFLHDQPPQVFKLTSEDLEEFFNLFLFRLNRFNKEILTNG